MSGPLGKPYRNEGLWEVSVWRKQGWGGKLVGGVTLQSGRHHLVPNLKAGSGFCALRAEYISSPEVGIQKSQRHISLGT